MRTAIGSPIRSAIFLPVHDTRLAPEHEGYAVTQGACRKLSLIACCRLHFWSLKRLGVDLDESMAEIGLGVQTDKHVATDDRDSEAGHASFRASLPVAGAGRHELVLGAVSGPLSKR